MTPLFPDPGTAIEFKQGQVSDCYLLASLDCILNHNKECRKQLESMFVQQADGSVTVRIKHNPYSSRLQLEALKRKYSHVKEANGDDLITISREQLERIDAPPSEVISNSALAGVTSNSLAVKILEHIAPYYYAEQIKVEEGRTVALLDGVELHPHLEGSFRRIDSTQVHGTKNRFSEEDESAELATDYIANLLGVDVIHYDSTNIDSFIKLLAFDATQPIYMSLLYGEVDAFGERHTGHALRVNHISYDKDTKKYTIKAINPWDNTADAETLCLTEEELFSRGVHFSIFSMDNRSSDLNFVLSYIDKEDAKYIQENPDLFNTILRDDLFDRSPINPTHLQGQTLTVFSSLIKDKISEHKACSLAHSDLEILQKQLSITPSDSALTKALLEELQAKGALLDGLFFKKFIVKSVAHIIKLANQYSSESAHNMLYRALIKCSMSKPPDYSLIPEEFHMREFVAKGVVSLKDIKTWFSEKEYLRHLLISFFSSDGLQKSFIEEDEVCERLTAQFTAIDPNLLDDEALSELIALPSKQIISALNALSKANKSYALALNEKIENYLFTSQPSEDQIRCFTELNQAPFEFTKRFNLILREANLFDVDFDACSTAAELNDTVAAWQEHLAQIETAPELVNAFKCVEENGFAAAIEEIITKKISDIHDKARKRLELIDPFEASKLRILAALESNTTDDSLELINKLITLYQDSSKKMDYSLLSTLISKLAEHYCDTSALDLEVDDCVHLINSQLVSYYFWDKLALDEPFKRIIPHLISKEELSELLTDAPTPPYLLMQLLRDNAFAHHVVSNSELIKKLQLITKENISECIDEQFMHIILSQASSKPMAENLIKGLNTLPEPQQSLIVRAMEEQLISNVMSGTDKDKSIEFIRHFNTKPFAFNKKLEPILMPIQFFAMDWTNTEDDEAIEATKRMLQEELQGFARDAKIKTANSLFSLINGGVDLLAEQMKRIDKEAEAIKASKKLPAEIPIHEFKKLFAEIRDADALEAHRTNNPAT